MQLFAIPLRAGIRDPKRASWQYDESIIVIGARDAETTVTFLAINAQGMLIEVDASVLVFLVAGNPSRGDFTLSAAVRLPVSQLSFME